MLHSVGYENLNTYKKVELNRWASKAMYVESVLLKMSATKPVQEIFTNIFLELEIKL